MKSGGAKMVKRVFLDANILLDFTLKRGHFEAAKTIFEAIINGQITAIVTTSSLNVCAHWLSKSYGSAKAKEVMAALLDVLEVAEPPKKVLRRALTSQIEDIEDAFQLYTALHYEADMLITQDKQLHQLQGPVLPIFDAVRFIEKYLPN
jgi:predicted nucleic acid-binding protein